jgi:predicted DNA-binding protein (UPF0251 family)
MNVELLEDIIQQSGLKKSFIAEKIGVSRPTFDAYLKKGDMKMSRVNALCEVLNIEDPAIREAVFFTPSGAFKAT